MSVKKKTGLGKGLDALFLDNDTSDENSNILININDIQPNRNQPRKDFDETELTYLADSIRQYGIIQPILVRPLINGFYQIIAGERRWRASRMIGLTDIPCIVKEISDSELLEIALIENLQREDLNIIEEALGYKELIDKFDMTQENVAQKIGKSRSAIANSLRLLNLPDKVINLVKTGDISAGNARALLSLNDDSKIIELADAIISKRLTVREVEKITKNIQTENNKSNKINIPKKDNFYQEVELSLKEHLGRKIKIITHKDKGILEIEFYNKEELSDLANKLSSIDK